MSAWWWAVAWYLVGLAVGVLVLALAASRGGVGGVRPGSAAFVLAACVVAWPVFLLVVIGQFVVSLAAGVSRGVARGGRDVRQARD